MSLKKSPCLHAKRFTVFVKEQCVCEEIWYSARRASIDTTQRVSGWKKQTWLTTTISVHLGKDHVAARRNVYLLTSMQTTSVTLTNKKRTGNSRQLNVNCVCVCKWWNIYKTLLMSCYICNVEIPHGTSKDQRFSTSALFTHLRSRHGVQLTQAERERSDHASTTQTAAATTSWPQNTWQRWLLLTCSLTQ